MPSHDRVWFAREAVRQLVKAHKMRRLYGAAHAHATSALSALGGLVRSFIKVHDSLALEVRKDGLFVGEESVLDESARDSNVAMALFVGGVRAVAFREGIADGELDRFLGIVAAPQDQDLAVLLGQEDLPHVHTICLDELSEGWDVPENLSEQSQRTIDALNKRAETLIEEVSKRRLFGAGDTTFELSDAAEELAKLDAMGGQGAFDGTSSDVGFVGVPDEALEGLRTETRTRGAGDVTRALVEIVLDALWLAPDEMPQARARWFLEAAPRSALVRGDLGLLASMLERYDKELSARASKDVAAARQRVVTALEPVIESLGRPEAVAELVGAVTSGAAAGGVSAFCRAASLLGAHGVTAAVSAYIQTTNKELRDALNEFIVKNAERNPAELVRLCAATVPTETVKWALFTASKQLRGTLAESLFAQALQHPEPAVRDYAGFLWRTHTPAGRLRAFLEALDAPDPAERVRAAETIASQGDATILDALKKVVDDPKFLDRTPEEKKAILGAVAKIGGTSSSEFLRRQMDRPTGIFRRRAGAEIREEAARLLDSLKRPPQGGAR